ncbi:hypothetical protein A1Q1_05388 [Trichosporon asahii var. asahii CBS 2479]|uniref:Retrotransposon gag domain-containing protein n=1 Tax=Trichosporon asahii var. asahii (strain ATCC 90039 / CBS 2479 / JCM 2466 / KCTC 7840 / NBRC 103889/ NCYC 2677 / UAMH 7654) TaxID=1186058 RepID=J5Q8W8_TRIAS|nr:hypothetical protein A1Q1_05388 [Trichosporon asahii var. asahii CBS 2479]EJT46093.1 hypothetical protein A1Q1_05388 [Trichosporon asahii var. asahii CBS 2479]
MSGTPPIRGSTPVGDEGETSQGNRPTQEGTEDTSGPNAPTLPHPRPRNQGERIANLEQLTRELLQRTEDQTQEVTQLRADNEDLQRRLERAGSQVTSRRTGRDTSERIEEDLDTMANAIKSNEEKPKDVKFPPNMEKFNGYKGDLLDFLTDCNDWIDLNPQSLNTDDRKIRLVGGMMEGGPKGWYRQYRSMDEADQPHFMTNYEEFCKELDRNWGDPDRKASYERDTPPSSGNNGYLRYPSDDRLLPTTFYGGLKDEIKDEVAREGREENFNDLVDQAIRIDNRLQARKKERRDTHSSNSYQGQTNLQRKPNTQERKSRTTTYRGNGRETIVTEKDSVTTTTRDDYKKNLDSSGRLSKEEMDRRKRLGLCFYCGKMHESWGDCPLRKQRARERIGAAPVIPKMKGARTHPLGILTQSPAEGN